MAHAQQPGGQGQGVVAGSACPDRANPSVAVTLDAQKSQAPQAAQAAPAQQPVPETLSAPAGSSSKPAVSLSESMLKLQEAVVEHTQDSPCGNSAMKKPAAARTSLKRPAGKTMAMPKSKPKGKAQAKPQMSNEEKRVALLRTIPAALKKKYANGCSRCRERPQCTISCWKLRGYEI